MHVNRAIGRAGGLLLAVAALAASAGRPALAQAPTTAAPEPPGAGIPREQELEARIARLEARVRELSPQAKAPPSPRPGPARDLPLRGSFGPGFELKTDDDEFQCQYHNLTQVDGRFFQQGGQDPVKDTFAIPREWSIFSGRMTRSFEYLASFAHGFGTVSLLDTYLNIHVDDRFQIKLGRYFVPFTYEPYILPIHALITPEFSLFFNNFEPNRDLGVMAWGRLARERVDYAVGVFNGTKNGLLDTNDAKDVIAFLNARPFLHAGIPALENLNLGASADAGRESSAANPRTLSTIVSIPGNATIGVPFLTFNNDVREAGERALGSLHAAYFYRRLSLIGEWDGGFQDYSGGNTPGRARLPVESYYVAAGFFLTGESAAARGAVAPLRPFDLREGHRGPGAWELGARYNALGVGGAVFTRGLADPNLWTDRVATTDVGLNWYLNQYLKIALFWEHAGFARPVLYRPGALQLTSDLVFLRFQLRF